MMRFEKRDFANRNLEEFDDRFKGLRLPNRFSGTGRE